MYFLQDYFSNVFNNGLSRPHMCITTTSALKSLAWASHYNMAKHVKPKTMGPLAPPPTIPIHSNPYLKQLMITNPSLKLIDDRWTCKCSQRDLMTITIFCLQIDIVLKSHFQGSPNLNK
jgi:hypothetical protein